MSNLRTKKSTVISKRPQTPTFQALFLSLNNRAGFSLDFSRPCLTEGSRRHWFPLAEVKEIANSGGKIRQQWWSIFSSTLTISMVPVRHYNCSWHLFFFSHSLRLETRVHLQFPQLLLYCAINHLYHRRAVCLCEMASAGVYFIVAIGLRRANRWRQAACKGLLSKQIFSLTFLCKQLAKELPLPRLGTQSLLHSWLFHSCQGASSLEINIIGRATLGPPTVQRAEKGSLWC